MATIHMPSKALIEALGWDAINAIDTYFDDAVEELRAERRRLEAARHHAALRAPGEVEVLRRLADVEYALRLEIVQTRTRLERKLDELTREVSHLRHEIQQPNQPEER